MSEFQRDNEFSWLTQFFFLTFTSISKHNTRVYGSVCEKSYKNILLLSFFSFFLSLFISLSLSSAIKNYYWFHEFVTLMARIKNLYELAYRRRNFFLSLSLSLAFPVSRVNFIARPIKLRKKLREREREGRKEGRGV